MQLFRKHEFDLDLLQTLDDHAAAVADVKFLDTATLLSISSDRTIIVRKVACGKEQSIAFISIRVITLKASPVSLTVVPAEPSVVLISTLDRQILRYNVSSGRLLHSFKASDPTTGDSVLISSLEVHKLDHLATTSRLIFGVSSTDKSIRIHEYDSGAMLTREYGQNAVSAVKLLRRYVDAESPSDHLISCGLDGTVMKWVLSSSSPKPSPVHDNSDGDESPSRQPMSSAQPLRRILSKAKILDLQKSLASESDTETSIQGSSLSRIRRKTSRYGFVAAPKISTPARPYPAGISLSSADARLQRQISQGSPPTPSTQKVTLKSKSKPPSLDSRRRCKSAANLNDLKDLGEQICIGLRTFRSRITASSVAKLEHDTLLELAKELDLTIRALDDKAISKHAGGEALGDDVLDVYLAKSIDERLAQRARFQEITFVDDPRSEAKGFEQLVDVNAGGQGTALELR